LHFSLSQALQDNVDAAELVELDLAYTDSVTASDLCDDIVYKSVIHEETVAAICALATRCGVDDIAKLYAAKCALNEIRQEHGRVAKAGLDDNDILEVLLSDVPDLDSLEAIKQKVKEDFLLVVGL